jgi:starch phosphorylase
VYEANTDVRRVLQRLRDGTFSAGDRALFEPIAHALIEAGDPYMHLCDFEDYARTQELIGRDFCDLERWSARAIINVARCARFSSDRTIQEYARDIWNLQRVI